MPNPPNVCPNCKASIPPDAPGGLCPACLLLGAAGPTQAAPGALASAPSIDEVRSAFPELEILELVGHGGMGVIFKARQSRLDRMVALKILPPGLARQPGFAERFTREARALARLSHPNIVAVYDFGERGTLPYLMMEFVHGVNLRQAMRAGVTPEQALGLVPRICEALQFAHDRGVLHRDIKPENILLDTNGVPKLADFGIAKLAEDRPGATQGLTLSGSALGTAAYMAPEQIEKPGAVDHRADIYSLGVVLYEMLTGELPLGRFAAPSEKAKVNQGVDEVVFRALEKERERRQQSANEMKTQVEHATAMRSAPAGPRGPGVREAIPSVTGTPADVRLRAPGGIAPVFLMLAILTALLIPLSAANSTMREYASPVTLSFFVAIFGALYALWPVFVSQKPAMARRADADTRRPSYWWFPAICAFISVPFAVLAALLMIPRVQATGNSPILGILVALVIPLVAALGGALISAMFRALLRAGAPKWGAFVIAIFVALMAVPGGCMLTYLAARQRQLPTKLPHTMSSYATSPSIATVTAERAPFIGRWPMGTVELVAITRHPSADAPWWRMDGLRASEGPFTNPGGQSHKGRGDEAYEFYFRTTDLPSGSSGPHWLFEAPASWASGGTPALAEAPERPLAGYHVIAATLPADLNHTGIKAGLGYEAWKTLSSHFPLNFTERTETHEGLTWKITHGTAHETKEGFVVTFSATRHADWERRVVAVTADGTEIPTTRVSIVNDQSEWHFSKPLLKDVRELRFQVRPIRWVDFRPVALKPGS